jgi:dolichyl-phosphate-mannose-protein mannosyltransferase
VKKLLLHIINWEFFWLVVFVVATVAMHVSIINQIQDTILDEVYYAGYYEELHGDLHYGAAHSILELRTDPRPEHPPLAKLCIAAGIKIFGDNYVGWRAPSIFFGTASVVLLFFICRKLGMSRRATNLATFLFTFENFAFMIASVAMLDVFFVTFMLAAFLLYLYRRSFTYFFSGIFIGLAGLSKLFGALGAPAIFIHWLFSRVKKSYWFLITIVMAPASFVGLFPVFDYVITGKWENPLTRIKEMLSLTSSLTFYNVDHPNLARPWEWLLNFRPMAFYYNPHYDCALSPALWGVMIPVVLYLLYRSIKQRNEGALFGLAWFAGTFLFWIPISIATNRVSFIFYFYPTIGALCLGLGLGLNEAIEWATQKRKLIKIPVLAGVTALLLFHLVSFVALTPVFFRGGFPFFE